MGHMSLGVSRLIALFLQNHGSHKYCGELTESLQYLGKTTSQVKSSNLKPELKLDLK